MKYATISAAVSCNPLFTVVLPMSETSFSKLHATLEFGLERIRFLGFVHRPVLSQKHNDSETGSVFRPQVK
jgi:hypothetical protein